MLRLLLLEEMLVKLTFGSLIKANRMKNSDLNEKIGNYHDKKNYIIAMSNNTPEATTEQQ